MSVKIQVEFPPPSEATIKRVMGRHFWEDLTKLAALAHGQTLTFKLDFNVFTRDQKITASDGESTSEVIILHSEHMAAHGDANHKLILEAMREAAWLLVHPQSEEFEEETE